MTVCICGHMEIPEVIMYLVGPDTFYPVQRHNEIIEPWPAPAVVCPGMVLLRRSFSDEAAWSWASASYYSCVHGAPFPPFVCRTISLSFTTHNTITADIYREQTILLWTWLLPPNCLPQKSTITIYKYITRVSMPHTHRHDVYFALKIGLWATTTIPFTHIISLHHNKFTNSARITYITEKSILY